MATANGSEKKKEEKNAGYLLLFDWSESSGTRPACALYSEGGEKEALFFIFSYLKEYIRVEDNLYI